MKFYMELTAEVSEVSMISSAEMSLDRLWRKARGRRAQVASLRGCFCIKLLIWR